ncbi:hypothetical protein CCAX7_12510 [Capsulimonas corticalis]|uniref:Uncharacterized protein n=1 Tax=Capsulimonas corticalis TaxID=2219043 RepID=A0A402D4C8_9BACT|nr:BsuPI-related putative proteinase inhibitor [Capsulimonas corticalis]BDI29200.1 hypothetical protein CCAX7_12510 [Capsulimonas corticalis]
MKLPHYSIASAPLLLLCLTGCGGGSSDSGGSSMPNPSGQYGPIQVTEQTDKASYAVGEPIDINFTWKNTSVTPQPYLEGAPPFDVTVYHGSEKVWTYSNSVTSFPSSVLEGQLPAGAVKSEKIVWDQKDQTGHTLSPGTYQVYAVSHVQFSDVTPTDGSSDMGAKLTTITLD